MPEKATRLVCSGLPRLGVEYEVVVRERGQFSAEAKKLLGDVQKLEAQLKRELAAAARRR